MAKQVLGKGLAALIPQKKAEAVKSIPEEHSLLLEIDIKKVKRNQYQPRMDFDKNHLNDLKASIKENGILQPVMVRVVKKGEYELIAGERRFRAAKELGFKTIPAMIKKATKEESLEFALIENIQRDNLNPIEEANAYMKLSQEFSLTQDDIAKKVGKARTVITNSLRLLKLPKEIQEMLISNKLSTGHARPLLSIEGKKNQLELAKRIIAKNLSVRQVEEIVQRTGPKKLKDKVEKTPQTSQIVAMKEDMQRVLGTKVHIKHKGKKGKIEIEYYSNDDLTRIWEIFKVDNY